MRVGDCTFVLLASDFADLPFIPRRPPQTRVILAEAELPGESKHSERWQGWEGVPDTISANTNEGVSWGDKKWSPPLPSSFPCDVSGIVVSVFTDATDGLAALPTIVWGKAKAPRAWCLRGAQQAGGAAEGTWDLDAANGCFRRTVSVPSEPFAVGGGKNLAFGFGIVNGIDKWRSPQFSIVVPRAKKPVLVRAVVEWQLLFSAFPHSLVPCANP